MDVPRVESYRLSDEEGEGEVVHGLAHPALGDRGRPVLPVSGGQGRDRDLEGQDKIFALLLSLVIIVISRSLFNPDAVRVFALDFVILLWPGPSLTPSPCPRRPPPVRPPDDPIETNRCLHS